MLLYIAKKLAYSLLVMFGVVTVVFLLFNVLPGDPARMMLGQRADVSSIEAINKDLGRDKPLSVQYLLYINDLSPVSYHDIADTNSSIYLNKEKYGSTLRLLPGNEHTLVLKVPYLR